MGSKNLEESLKIVNKRHDLIALQVNDPFEEELPKLGLINVKDAESGETQWINTSSKKVRTKWKAEAIARNKKLANAFRKSGVDYVKIETNKSYIIPLMNLFKRR